MKKAEETRRAPIGVFDSGVGGISVVKALERELPGEDLIFFGDSKNAPYGEKSVEEIRALSERSYQFLRGQRVKAVVIACNTATSAAAELLREENPGEIIVGMEPALKPAIENAGRERPEILVLATSSTLGGERFHRLTVRLGMGARVHSLPAPEIVRMVEAGMEDSDEMRSYLRELLLPYRRMADGTIRCPLDGLVLGCTHFPFAKRAIREVLSYPVPIYDGAEGTARETKRRLLQKALLSDRKSGGRVRLYSSLPDTELEERLLNKES